MKFPFEGDFGVLELNRTHKSEDAFGHSYQRGIWRDDTLGRCKKAKF